MESIPSKKDTIMKETIPKEFSKEFDFSDESDEEEFAQDPDAIKKAQLKIQKTMAEWIKTKTENINQRTFNINEIYGLFDRDWSGKIVNRDNILRKNYFRDLNGSVVNEMGYLIKEETGDILSKYTFDVVFKSDDLIGKQGQEIPLPYYMEQYNFRPMQCFGNFDYDAKGKPQILKDKFGQNIDNNLRRVNASGWLID